MGSKQTQTLTKTYNGFSGVDMIVTFGGIWIGELQGVSYSVTREKAPRYTMGHANPRSFSRGKRGIAGALVFALFDTTSLLYAMNNIGGPVPGFGGAGNTGDFSANNDPAKGQIGYKHWMKSAGDNFGQSDGQLGLTQVKNRYIDQILPFNIVISAANEYGVRTGMEIIGIELMNMGSGMSIDDITTDETCSFLARDIRHWENSDKSSGQGDTAISNDSLV